MASNITVRVHVKPYIKKYLIHISDNKAEPIIFPKRHHFTNLLLPLLVSKNRYDLLRFIETDQNRPTDYADIMLPWQKTYGNKPHIMYRRYLSPCSEREFRISVERYYKMMANEFITEKLYHGHTRTNAINMFLQELMITEDDINIESLYRGYSRLKNTLC